MKAMILLCFCLITASCSPYGFNPMGYEVKHENLDEAWKKVAAMKYIPEAIGIDYWKSPHEFFEDGGGDCEDFAVALIYYLGPESSAIRINLTESSHYIVFYHGLYIEPQIIDKYYNELEITILNKYDYNFVIRWATKIGNKTL